MIRFCFGFLFKKYVFFTGITSAKKYTGIPGKMLTFLDMKIVTLYAKCWNFIGFLKQLFNIFRRI